MLGEQSASPALMQALGLGRSFQVLSAVPTQHTGPECSQPEAGLLWDPRRLVRPAPASFIPSLLPSLFPVLPCLCHPCTPGKVLSSPPRCSQDISCKISMSQGAAVLWVTVCNPFGAGVCPGSCGVSGSSGAGIQSTTEVLSVTQHQLEVFSHMPVMH